MESLNEILHKMGTLRNCTTKDNDNYYLHASHDGEKCACGLTVDYMYPKGSIITAIDCRDCIAELIRWIEIVRNEGPEWESLVDKAFEISSIKAKLLGN